jgi:SAM-dependent methyltransferase
MSGAMLSKCRVDEKGFSGFFDSVAEDYLQRVMENEEFYRGIVDHLERENILRCDDEVLDISCGPGTYTLPMAKRTRSVSSLDPAEGMLSVLMREAANRGLLNVRTIKSKWEDYGGEEKFDLVFVALSPGIRGPNDFLKMERFSRRNCCYIGFGKGGKDSLGDEIWEQVMGEKRKNNDFNITIPFNLLHAKGRKPNVRFFEKSSLSKEPGEEVIKSNTEWLSMYTKMDRAKKKKVRDYVNDRSTDGYYEHDAVLSLVALYWEVPK